MLLQYLRPFLLRLHIMRLDTTYFDQFRLVVPKVWGAPPWGAQEVRNYFIH
jgi:hypothetical protein